MTLQQLYDWAKKEGKENLDLRYGGDEDLPFVLDFDSDYTPDDSISLIADPREMVPDGDYYGIIFDGKELHYIEGNREVSKEYYFRYETEE